MMVMTNDALATDPHLTARETFVDLFHPELGSTRVMRQPWLFSDLPCELRPGPLMGQDNLYMLESLLGIPADARNQLSEVLV